jgi:hypothetical protein
VSPAVSGVRLAYDVDADASPEMLDEILEVAKALSPVYTIVTGTVAVDAQFAGRGRAH